MTVSEAGRKGGVRVRETRGRKFYEEIGKKGGETVKAERGRKFYEEIGKKGGDTVKAERGPRFYEEIGKKGGETIKAERGTPFYEEIGRKGGHKVRELIEKGKAGGGGGCRRRPRGRRQCTRVAAGERDEVLWEGVDDGGRGEGRAARRSRRRAAAGMTVSEAGRKGGIAVRDERGHAFYEEIGRKGGQKVRELIERGKSPQLAHEEPERRRGRREAPVRGTRAGALVRAQCVRPVRDGRKGGASRTSRTRAESC